MMRETVPSLIQPDDEYNRVLAENVHPAEWINPEPRGRYNLVVIGAGTAGLVTAAIASALGAKVALIERHLMGGDCLNVGCVPSKALVRAARAWSDVRQAHVFGLHTAGTIKQDFAAVMAPCASCGHGSAPMIRRNDSKCWESMSFSVRDNSWEDTPWK